jgi:predicted permease
MKWSSLFRRRQWDEERAQEIDSYLEMETAENLACGMSASEAAAAARRKFGNPTLIREEIHRMNSMNRLESIWQDLRYGARLLRLSPAFTTVAVLSLALGIGANTAIFQLLDAVRLRSLPVERPEELAEVRIAGGNSGMGLNPGRYGGVTRPIWEELRRQQQAFSGLPAWNTGTARLGRSNDARWVQTISVSGEFFSTLGVLPLRGRLFRPEDEALACPNLQSVVSYAFWQTEMGGRELGPESKLYANGKLYEVIGVAPAHFTGVIVGEKFDMAFSFCRPEKEPRRDVFDLSLMGRLKPGWTLEQAKAHLESLSKGIMEATEIQGYGSSTVERYKTFRLAAYPGANGVSTLRADYDSSLWLLLGITGLVLLIACANLANLMLARSGAREREIAVRLALGASRGRLLRQFTAESMLLAMLGALLGVSVARILSGVLVASLSTESNKIHLPLELDWRVLLFAAAAAALTCLVFGALPALRVTRMEPDSVMRSGGRGLTAGRERFSMQRAMMVTQIAVSLILLVGALLFVRSFRNLMTVDAGLRQKGITVAFVGMPGEMSKERLEGFQRELLEEVQSIPGVRSAGSTTNVPLFGGSWTHAVKVGAAQGSSKFTWVSAQYFETMGVPLLAGRIFNPGDTASSTRVAIVNQTFVKTFCGGTEPLGQTLRTGAEPNYPSTVYEIVGVIPDTKYDGLRGNIPPMAFAPNVQFPGLGPWASLMIHSDVPSAAVAANLKSRLGQKFPGMVVDVLDFQARIQDGLVRERMMAILSGFFGGLAAILAMVGLYGVVSYIVARRRNEIGIRMALGARKEQVVGMVMRDATRLLLFGIAIGGVLSLAATRSAGTLLFGLKPYDPLTMTAAAVLLGAIAVGASYVPARRAANLDPMAALRHD